MNLGQMLSLDPGDILPRELARVPFQPAASVTADPKLTIGTCKADPTIFE